uniref:Uncharacterized protein n=1 Tax=Romanomermis culicivorax TaxID=13658 RepID=A0A915KT97_ROMCU
MAKWDKNVRVQRGMNNFDTNTIVHALAIKKLLCKAFYVPEIFPGLKYYLRNPKVTHQQDAGVTAAEGLRCDLR